MFCQSLVAQAETQVNFRGLLRELRQYEMIATPFNFLRKNMLEFHTFFEHLGGNQRHPLIGFSKYMLNTPRSFKSFVGREYQIVLTSSQILIPSILIRNYLKAFPDSKILVLNPISIRETSAHEKTSLYVNLHYWKYALGKKAIVQSSYPKNETGIDFLILNSDDSSLNFSESQTENLSKHFSLNPDMKILCSNSSNARRILKYLTDKNNYIVRSFGPDNHIYWREFYNRHSQFIKEGKLIWLGKSQEDDRLPRDFPIPQVFFED